MFHLGYEKVNYSWVAGIARGDHKFETAEDAYADAERWIANYRPDVKSITILRHSVQEMRKIT